MSAITLQPSFREKVWGSTRLEPWFPNAVDKTGEVWFEHAPALPILIKFLFTTEKLSVQVHPAGPVGTGKTEMWHILHAEPNARIALGFEREVTAEEVRRAAADGSVESLLRWYPVKAGDTYFTPAGTVHAIGAGVTLVEIQQNSDITFRLFDYGRPRELHLDQALAIADLGEHPGQVEPVDLQEGRQILAACEHFVVERWRVRGGGVIPAGPERLVVCTAGSGTCNGTQLKPGTVLLVSGEASIIEQEPLSLLLAHVPAAE